jgi:hypothetical protein
MSLLNFPSSPVNGQLYPVAPLTGQTQYQWEATTGTWRIFRGGGGGGGVEAVLGTLPIRVNSADPAFPIVSIDAATQLARGTMSSADKIKLDGLSNYILPPATSTILGGIKVGDGLAVTFDGRLSVVPTVGVTSVTGVFPVVSSGGNTPEISVNPATTFSLGVVQLNDTNTGENNDTQAATANMIWFLQQQINALLNTTNLTLAGLFDAATGLVTTTTSDGFAAGFRVGSDLPDADLTNKEYFVIVTVSGLYDPPGGGGPYLASKGDWFLSDGTQWLWLDVTDPSITSLTATQPVVLTGSETAPNITITTVSQTAAGVMSAADKIKLDGLGPLTPATSSVLGGIIVGSNLSITADGTLSAGASGVSTVTATLPIVATVGSNPRISINAATTTTAGSLSAADKIRVNNAVQSDTTLVAGSDRVNNMVVVSQAEFNAIVTKNANTIYVIVG